MMTIHEIIDTLAGLSFEEAASRLGRFDSYERTVALAFVMQRARRGEDRIKLFLEWGNVCDAPWAQRSHFAEMLREACSQTSLAALLDEPELEFYRSLPDDVIIWRGCELGRERGLSWTTQWRLAEKFSRGVRCRNARPTLVEAVISKRHVLAVFVSRNEFEIVVDPRRLRKIKATQLERDAA
jgi:hypothetical protein